MPLELITVIEPCSLYEKYFCLITVFIFSNSQIDINIPELNPEMVRVHSF
jgi:hypothetical protein